MPNGSEMLDAIGFEEKINNLTGDELSRFIARQLYNHCEQNGKSPKFTGAIAGFASIIGGVIVGAVDYALKR